MMSLYLIGIGGTGAKCVEAAVHMAAIGLLSEEPTQKHIHILFIDPDESNGNLQQTRSSIKIYQNCHDLLTREAGNQTSWIKSEINSLGIWSPFSDHFPKDLRSLFNYDYLKTRFEPLANLLDVLYTKSERETSLNVGFRGKPAIGSAIMSQVTLEQLEGEPWRKLLNNIRSDASIGEISYLFFYGSLFGGTGASALPTISRLFANKLEIERIRNYVKIGGVFLLPYFQFHPPINLDPNIVFAHSDLFMLNTEASLHYYATQAEGIFDTVYLLGSPNLSKVDRFSIGNNSQHNKSHIIEFYAALATRNFLLKPPSENLDKGIVSLISKNNFTTTTWDDLPESKIVKSALVNATRFAYVWLSNIVPELDYTRRIGVNKFQTLAPWFIQFFRPNLGFMRSLFIRQISNLPDFNDDGEQEAISLINLWCKDYLRWLAEIHDNESNKIDLFNPYYFAHKDGKLNLKGDYLSKLVSNDERDLFTKERDTVQKLMEILSYSSPHFSESGVIGLAKALYSICRL